MRKLIQSLIENIYVVGGYRCPSELLNAHSFVLKQGGEWGGGGLFGGRGQYPLPVDRNVHVYQNTCYQAN